MRKMLGFIAATVTAIAVMVPSAAPVSALRVGYGQFGGYDVGGYEYS